MWYTNELYSFFLKKNRGKERAIERDLWLVYMGFILCLREGRCFSVKKKENTKLLIGKFNAARVLVYSV